MKKQYGKIAVPVMLGVLCAAPAFAQEDPPPPFVKTYAEAVDVTLSDYVSTDVSRTNSNDTSFSITGNVEVTGTVEVDSSISALVDNKQMNHDNHVKNQYHENTAEAGASVLQDAAGNIGLNIAAGDNNLQDNAAALAAADATFAFGEDITFDSFGAADATVVVNQDTVDNCTWNKGTTNTASLDGDSLSGASGNIGVNIAAGNSNLQKNNFAGTAAAADIATAAVTVMQQADGNYTKNTGTYVLEGVTIGLTGGLSQSNSSGNPATVTGTYSGQSDSYGDLFPDTWTGLTHAGGAQTGHIDLDNVIQAQLPNGTPLGASDIDPNGDGGVLLLNEEGTINGELNNLQLAGAFTGTLYQQVADAPTINHASLGANVLMGATGNIGVNVAAGTNNVQSNSLAMIASAAATSNGSGE